MSEGSWLTRPNSALIAIDTNVITFVKLDTFSETFESEKRTKCTKLIVNCARMVKHDSLSIINKIMDIQHQPLDSSI